ncbi:MAG: ATP-binding cassette domain-containing protein [Firmicutes bacterium]|nr:ATP-binding cassette domain-containing protein [Bacillota bacterium]
MQIDIHNLSFAYGHKSVINGLSLTLNSGDYLIVKGKNGSGKSTFIKCLLGINPVKNGMIFFDHQDINNFKDWTNFGYVSQKFEDFNYEFPITVNELLSVSSLKKTKQSDRLKLLDQMGILDLINQNINNLSGGQLQRVFIVKAMINSPKLLILDEPTASIDRLNTEFFYRAINLLNQQGITIILITHTDAFEELLYSHVLTMKSDTTFTFLTKEKCDLSEVNL